MISKKSFKTFFYLFPFALSNSKETSSSFERGKTLFISHCNICHIQGKNLIISEKNLKKETLEINGLNSQEAISYQISNGKNGMPAFGGRLQEEEIENIAKYVLEGLQVASTYNLLFSVFSNDSKK